MMPQAQPRVRTRFVEDGGFDVDLYVQGRSFDAGHRGAILDQLDALIELAARQVERSAETAGHELADDVDQREHAWDRQVWYALHALREARAAAWADAMHDGSNNG
jgi:hypothetical protein